MRLFSSVVLVALACIACREPDGGNGTPTDAGSGSNPNDADPGAGCAARSPRSVAPEVFVGPTGLQSKLTSLIDGATRSLDVGIYLFTVTSIADRIVAAHDRGVAVRVLFDPDHTGNSNVRNRLQSNGVPHRNASNLFNFYHAKYMIVDRDTAVIMSMNFNVDAMSDERNYGMIDRDPDDVADVQAIFDQDWAAGGGQSPMPADLACTRLVVSPTNSRTRILELIDRATQTLEVEAIYVSDPSVRDAIVAAKQRGVAVRVILDEPQDDAGTIPFLRGMGIEVHTNTSFLLHAKLLIADGVAFVGSENFSTNALTRNREIGALIFEPTPANTIRQQFEADWTASQ